MKKVNNNKTETNRKKRNKKDRKCIWRGTRKRKRKQNRGLVGERSRQQKNGTVIGSQSTKKYGTS
jgi:hypothetical protein